MNNETDIISQSVIRYMSEGVLTVGLNGKVLDINPAAQKILCKSAEDIVGKPFASSFFGYEENDCFNQTVLDAVYEAGVRHKNIVEFYTGQQIRHIALTTSYLLDGDKKIAVIAVINDISELYELRDAVKAMQHISRLNEQLSLRNKLLNETFGRYLSDDIVKQLLDTPDGLALGGKKQELTILMSDLRGFTVMSEKMKPQELVCMLNHYLGCMTESIQKYSGTIIEFIGDGILAIFGAPHECRDHASQAVACAIEMQSKMPDINEWNRQHGFPVLEMGIGINTGDVIVGNIGSEKRTKYGVCGSNVNLCGRIESYTTGGQVIISPYTRERVSEPLTVAQEFSVKPKGVEQPVTLSRITGIGAPYDISFVPDVPPLVRLETPQPVTFYTIDGKHTSDELHKGFFTSKSELEAVLQTDVELEVYDNINLHLDGKINAKVTEITDGNYKIRFTSK